MRDITTDNIRTIGLFGQASTGKTSLGEALLYAAKATRRPGKVDDNTSVLSSSPEEMERKITINLSCFSFDHNGVFLNIIDTPGYDDFYGEVLCGIRSVDIAIIVIDPEQEIGIVTERLFLEMKERNIPTLLFLSKTKDNVEIDNIISGLKSIFGSIVPVVVIEGGTAVSLFKKDSPYHSKLVEAIVETDDALLERYLSDEEIKREELEGAFYGGIGSGKLSPLYIGDSLQGIGIKEIFSAVTELPLKRDSEEFKGLIFKTRVDPHLGDMRYIKVLGGELSPGIVLYNCTKKANERINQIYIIKGSQREEVSKLSQGGVAGLVKLKSSSTGDTLASAEGDPLPKIDFLPTPVSTAIVPQEKKDEEKVMEALSKLHQEDPSFRYYYDQETKQTIVSGRGELHIDIVIEKLKRKYGVKLSTERPKIHYRETIKQTASAQGKFKRQTGGHGQYGDCWLKVEPLEKGEGFQFVNAIFGGSIPSKYLPSIEKGVKEAMDKGIIAGYPVVDMKVTCYDGTFHSVDSSDIAFKIAGSLAFKNVCEQAMPTMLEPIIAVEITVPEEYMGDIMGDLNSRRGRILGTEAQGRFQLIKAQVPEAELYGYSASLRSITAGRGTFTQQFLRYEEAPRELQTKIIEESRKKGDR